MGNEKLTFTIGGREALPVRAIPYVTGWQMSPDVVARSMAKVEPPPPFPALLQGLSGYHLPYDTPVEIMPREWDATVTTIEGYEAELKRQHPDDAIGYAAWRKDSVEKLPAGAFVWLDEFARERTADRARVLKGKQRHGDDELIAAPMLDEATRAMVREGFGSRKLHAANNPKDEATRRDELRGWFDYTMNAAMWFKRASVKPDEAAMLLWRLDPLNRDWRGNAPDPERTYVDGDETSPRHYRALKRVFEDVAMNDPKPRTLLDWRDVAKHEGLRYHQWIDEYVQAAQIEELPVTAPATNNDKSGLRKRELQIQTIEKFADELGYQRDAIPSGGKKKLMEKCKEKEPNLFGAGDDPFKDAWKEASSAKRIQIMNRQKYLPR